MGIIVGGSRIPYSGLLVYGRASPSFVAVTCAPASPAADRSHAFPDTALIGGPPPAASPELALDGHSNWDFGTLGHRTKKSMPELSPWNHGRDASKPLWGATSMQGTELERLLRERLCVKREARNLEPNSQPTMPRVLDAPMAHKATCMTRPEQLRLRNAEVLQRLRVRVPKPCAQRNHKRPQHTHQPFEPTKKAKDENLEDRI